MENVISHCLLHNNKDIGVHEEFYQQFRLISKIVDLDPM